MLLNSLRLMVSRTEDNFRHNRSSGFGKEFIILLSHFYSRNLFIETWTKLSNGQKLLEEICGNSKIQNIISYKHLPIFKRWSWWDDCFKTEMLLWKYALWKENMIRQFPHFLIRTLLTCLCVYLNFVLSRTAVSASQEAQTPFNLIHWLSKFMKNSSNSSLC